MRRTLALAGYVFVAAFGYAVVRYVVLSDTPAAHIPLFISNKAVALVAVTLLSASILDPSLAGRQRAGRAGLAASGLHAVLSLTLLAAAYFPRFYRGAGGGGLTFLAELALFSGALALTLLAAVAWPAGRSGRRRSRRRLATTVQLVLALTALHSLAFGWSGWWTPREWPGSLPPLTLIGFIIASGAVIFAVARRHRRAGQSRPGHGPWHRSRVDRLHSAG